MSKSTIGTQPHTLNSQKRVTNVIFDRKTGVIHAAHHVFVAPGSPDTEREVQGQSVRTAMLRRTAAAAGLPVEQLDLMLVPDLPSTELASLYVDVARRVLVPNATSQHSSSAAGSAAQPRPRRPI